MTSIFHRFDADLINISKVTSRKTKWTRFFGLPCISFMGLRWRLWVVCCGASTL